MGEAVLRRPAVVLVGFMGAGKSDVGARLAAALALPFVDTDELIEAAAGPIAGIFAERGEEEFRALEAQIVTAAIVEVEKRPCVLALGGGAVLSDDVREALRRMPHVVWLDAPADVLWARVAAAGAEKRPLAGDEEAFSALLAVREPLYREVATRVIETDGRSVAAVADEIAAEQTAGTEGRGTDAIGSAASAAEGRGR